MTNTRLHSLQTFCFAPAQQVCPQKNSLAACPSGRRAGWAVRLFDSLVLSEIPNAVLCLCADWAKRPTPGPFRKPREMLMVLVKLLPQLLSRNRRSQRGAKGEPAVFWLDTIDAPTIGQIEGCKQVWAQ